MKRALLILTTLCCLLLPAAAGEMALAAPYNPLGGACGAVNNADTACTADGSDPITGPHGIIRKVSAIVATIAGVAAVIIIIVAGFEFVTANGDAQQAATARTALIGATVGLIIIVVAEGLVVFVLTNVQKG